MSFFVPERLQPEVALVQAVAGVCDGSLVRREREEGLARRRFELQREERRLRAQRSEQRFIAFGRLCVTYLLHDCPQ